MEEKVVKLLKKDYFYILRDLVIEHVEGEKQTDLVAFIDKQLELIDNKSLKAKERAAAKKEAGDELREKVQGLLTTEYQTVNDIVALINDEEITKQKIVARLTQLVKNGVVDKESQTIDGKKVMTYKIKD